MRQVRETAASTRCIITRIATMGNWSSIPLGRSGRQCQTRASELSHQTGEKEAGVSIHWLLVVMEWCLQGINSPPFWSCLWMCNRFPLPDKSHRADTALLGRCFYRWLPRVCAGHWQGPEQWEMRVVSTVDSSNPNKKIIQISKYTPSQVSGLLNYRLKRSCPAFINNFISFWLLLD